MSLVIPEIISLYIRVHVIPKYLPFRTIHDKRKKIGEVKSKGKQYGCFESFPFRQNFVIFVRQIT